MARFVTFPGTAGSFASTDDVNLLDADSAHFQQGIGTWNAALNGQTPVQSQAQTPVFGDFVLQLEGNSSGTVQHETAAGTGGVPVTVALSYSVATRMWVAETFTRLRVLVSWFDAGGSFLSSGTIYDEAAVADTQIDVAGTVVAPALSAFAAVAVIQSSAPANSVIWLSGLVLREGTDAAFIPSLRIVGDLDYRIDCSPVIPPPDNMGLIGTARSGVQAGTILWIDGGSTDLRVWHYLGTSLSQNQTAAYAFVNGERVRIQVTIETDGLITYYKDEVQIDTDTFGPGAPTAPFGEDLRVGILGDPSIETFAGDMYSAELRDGLDGPIVAVFDPDDITI